MLKSLLNSAALKPIIMGQLRHVVTVAGTSLATTGYIGSSDVESAVGAAMVIVSLILSAVSKKMAA